MMSPLEYRAPDQAESQAARRRIIIRIGIIILSVVVALVASVVIVFVIITRRLDENLRKADDYIAVAKVMLAKDRRFQNVELGDFTELGGSVLVEGTVATSSDLSALQRCIQMSTPPVPVLYHVQVVATTNPSTAP